MFLTHSALASVKHGFFGRNGGVSEGVFDSLNCGWSNADKPECVTENRRRAMVALDCPPESLTTLYQIHSADVVTLTAPIAPSDRPRADAAVTATRGVTLGVLTADCGPLLFLDPKAQVIGAAHSGWRGTQGNIAENTIAAMVALGAQRPNIIAVLGPCIAQESYEVSAEFTANFSAEFFRPSVNNGHFMFDLKGVIQSQLEAAQVGEIIILPHDTRAEADRFFSNRRHMLESKDGFGLQLSAISLL